MTLRNFSSIPDIETDFSVVCTNATSKKKRLSPLSVRLGVIRSRAKEIEQEVANKTDKIMERNIDTSFSAPSVSISPPSTLPDLNSSGKI